MTMPTAAPAPTTKRTRRAPAAGLNTGAAIDAGDLARLHEQERLAKLAGLALPPPIYALGTPVNAIGQCNVRAFRQKWEARPAFNAVCDQAIDRIAAERRANEEVDLSHLWMDASGQLQVVNKATMATTSDKWNMTKAGITGLCSGMGVAAGTRYLLAVPADCRSMNLNYHAMRIDPKQWILRTRDCKAPDQAGQREVFAATSTKYPCMDADVLTNMARELFPTGARGDVLYDGERFRLSATYFTDVQPERACAGEMFRAWCAIETRDDAQGAIRVRWGVERNLCLNLIILGRAEQKLNVKHSGDVAQLRVAVQEALAKGAAAIRGFADKWNTAREDVILRGILDSGKWGTDQLVRALVQQDYVRVAGVGEDALVERICNAWQQEPGYTRADLVNAITRAAHENEWGTCWATSDLEEQAGELLYQKVYWQQVYDNADEASA